MINPNLLPVISQAFSRRSQNVNGAERIVSYKTSLLRTLLKRSLTTQRSILGIRIDIIQGIIFKKIFIAEPSVPMNMSKKAKCVFTTVELTFGINIPNVNTES